MAVIIEPDCLFYFRINSSDRYKPAILITREPEHTFLDHDSFLECKLPLEMTEFDVEQAFKKQGVIGRISSSLAEPIYAHVKANTLISTDDKTAIGLALVGAKRL